MGTMAEEIIFEVEPFVETCNRLYSKWKADSGDEAWGQGCDALVVVAGMMQDDVISFPKSLALHVACFAHELHDVLFAFCEDKIIALGARKKAELLQALSSRLPDSFKYKLQVLTRDKADKDKANFETIIANLKGDKSAVKVGMPKDKPVGAFAEEWGKALAAAEGMTTADITNGLADVLAIKTKQQLAAARGAGQVSARMFKNSLIEKILDAVDAEEATKMMDISDTIEKSVAKIAAQCEPKLDPDGIQVMIPPLIQSGGKYDLKWNAQTADAESLHLPGKGVPAIHVASLCVHNNYCCCSVARTLMFNAKKDQLEAYRHLVEVFEECVEVIKPGVPMRKIYEVASAKFKERDPKLLAALFKELGWGVGYEIRERRYVLDEKIKQPFQKDMLVCLRFGLEGLTTSSKDEKGKKYALLLGDTFIVTETGAVCITDGVPRKPKRVQWNVGEEEAESKKKEDKKYTSQAEIDQKLRELDRAKQKAPQSESDKKEYESRNAEIAAQRVQEQIRRREQGAGVQQELVRKVTTDYTETGDYPAKAFGHGKSYSQLCVDEKGQTLFVPVNGTPIPLHVSCIRNAQLQAGTDVGTGAVLRINLNAPGGGGLQPGNYDKKLTFLREICYRAVDVGNLQMVHKSIQEMKKVFMQAEKERQAKEEVQEQPALKLNPNRGPRLQNVRVYPNLQARGRKTEGDLEAHLNGFRFTAKKDKTNASLPTASRTVDIIYKNVKHAFFQPSNKHSNLIIIHLRLISKIMINKVAHADVQFYLEIDDAESLLDNKRRNTHDKDEIEDEERQKKVLAKLDKEFKGFCDKVQGQLPARNKSDPDGDKIWEWDIPYTELMFQGSPKNQMVELYPTVNCIVHLASKPVFIAELDEVDMVYYERVQPGGSNFDLAFIYKKFLNTNPAPKLAECWERIGTIDMKFMDSVKEVLQKSTIPQFEGRTTNNWTNILRDYIKNFDDITQDGGWNVVFGDDAVDSEEEDKEEEEDDDFEVDQDSDEDDEEESSDDYSEASEDDSDEYSDELSSEGMDSDEAERWAEEEDKRTREEEKTKKRKIDDSPPSKSKKAKSSSGGGGGGGKSGGKSGSGGSKKR